MRKNLFIHLLKFAIPIMQAARYIAEDARFICIMVACFVLAARRR